MSEMHNIPNREQSIEILKQMVLTVHRSEDIRKTLPELAVVCQAEIDHPIVQRVLLALSLHELRPFRLTFSVQLFASVKNWKYAKSLIEPARALCTLKPWQVRLFESIGKKKTVDDSNNKWSKEFLHVHGNYFHEPFENIFSRLTDTFLNVDNSLKSIPNIWIVDQSGLEKNVVTQICVLASLLNSVIVLISDPFKSYEWDEFDVQKTLQTTLVFASKYKDSIRITDVKGLASELINFSRQQIFKEEDLHAFLSIQKWFLISYRHLDNNRWTKGRDIFLEGYSAGNRNGFISESIIESVKRTSTTSPDSVLLWRFAALLQKNGYFTDALLILDSLPDSFSPTLRMKRVLECSFGVADFKRVVFIASGISDLTVSQSKMLRESRAVLDMVDQLILASEQELQGVQQLATTGKVVSILHASAPFQSGGYANRAHALLSEAVKNGFDVKPYTRPGFPEGINTFPDESGASDSRVGALEYKHGTSRITRKSYEYEYMLTSIEYYKELLIRENPAVVHLRSTYVSALPGLIASKSLGIPVIYEISGMWELVYEGWNTPRGESLRARTELLETIVCRNVDKVATVTAAMENIIIGRGVHPSRVNLLPNAVDLAAFNVREKNIRVLEELQWPADVPVIGYFGSFVDYEGLDVLVESLSIVREKFDIRILLVGDGASHAKVKSLVHRYGMSDIIHMPGRIPHDEIAELYSIVDICPFPRRRTPATERVSPLKPFEAMAMKKAIIVSDLPALTEIVGNGARGAICIPGSSISLAEQLMKLIVDSGYRNTLSKAGNDWVLEERNWARVGEKFTQILSSLSK